MRIRTALSAAFVSLAAVITLFVAGPGAEVHDTAADPLVIIAVEPEVASPAFTTNRPAPWECALDPAPNGDQ